MQGESGIEKTQEECNRREVIEEGGMENVQNKCRRGRCKSARWCGGGGLNGARGKWRRKDARGM